MAVRVWPAGLAFLAGDAQYIGLSPWVALVVAAVVVALMLRR